MPMISVIVPIYNSETYLNRCLDSVANQSYKDLEIILIDDGSDDNSYEIISRYALRDSRFKVYKCEHRGISSVRKMGIELARGEYIGFVDSDDWIELDMYERLYEFVSKYRCDLVSIDVYAHYENGYNTILYDNYTKGLYTDLYQDVYPTMLHDFSRDTKGLLCFLWSKLFRADILKKTIKCIDTRIFYGEDAMILYRYCLECESIYIIHEALYHYVIHIGSAETNPNENEPNNMYRLFSNLKEAFEESPYADILMPQLYQHALLLTCRVFRGIYGMDLAKINQWVFFTDEKIYGKRIVVYGAGICGRAFCKDLWKNGHADDVVAWVDRNPENVTEWEERYRKEFRHSPLGKAKPVSEIRSIDFDYIVITIRKESIAGEAIKELQEIWDVPREKIVQARSCRKNLSSMLLSAYL